MSKGHNARYTKLQVDYTDLMNLAHRSEFIKIDAVEPEPGWPPEKYLITFTCAGISAIRDDGVPIVSVFHQVEMYLSADYPRKIPSLLWQTEIWHPNIDHKEPRHVCTNDVQTFFASKPLSELVLFMAEMVQYRRYHAKLEPPFPLDLDAARWVREIAEPRGWFSQDRPFDPRPLLRPHLMVKASAEDLAAAANGGSSAPPKKGLGIHLGQAKPREATSGAADASFAPRKLGGISMGLPRSD